jgi:hypothetical protein
MGITDDFNEQTVTDLRDALAFMPSDDRGLWADVGQALKTVPMEGVGFKLWVEWSKKSDKYDEVDSMAKWKSFAADRTNYKTIFTKAQALGWVNPKKSGWVPTQETGLLNFRRSENGVIIPSLGNVDIALSSPDFCGWTIGYDTFRDELMFHHGDGEWQDFSDEHYVQLRIELPKRGFGEIRKELIHDAVCKRAKDNKFDSAQIWLASLKWDGTERVESFNSVYFGAKNTPYTRAVALYQWTAMAGRVLVPGVQADMVPILVGPQGMLKSTVLAALVPSQEFFCEISFSEKDDDLARKMRGTLVAEVSELRGFGTRDSESIKSFVTRRFEKWIPKFKEFKSTYPRRLVLIGTTNKTEFLCDDSGERRYLPLDVKKADRDAITRDRNQLWAEAAILFNNNGVLWAEAESLARVEVDQYKKRDPWQPKIEHYLWNRTINLNGNLVQSNTGITTFEIQTAALEKEPKNLTHGDSIRVATVMKALSYTQKRLYTEQGKKITVWEPN